MVKPAPNTQRSQSEGSLPSSAATFIVANRTPFEFRYGSGLNILGQWENGKRLNNGGEEIRLRASGTATAFRPLPG